MTEAEDKTGTAGTGMRTPPSEVAGAAADRIALDLH